MPSAECMYREFHSGRAEEDVPSREHVLADALGGRLMLADDAVCKACNNLLNREVDEPLKRMVQPFLNLFGVESSKTGSRANGVPVVAVVDGREVRAHFYSNGNIGVTPGPVTAGPVQIGGDLVWEFRALSEEHLEAWKKARREDGWTWEAEEMVKHEGKGLSLRELSFEGKALVPYRATAQTCLNYLAYRDPTTARDPALMTIRKFALLGQFDQAKVRFESSVDPSKTLDPERLAATHLVAIGADGRDCVMTLILFSVFAFKLTFQELFPSRVFHFEHAFDAVDGTSLVGDYWGNHPGSFLVPAGGDCAGAEASRIRRTDGLPDTNTLYVHEQLSDGRWRRCPTCSPPSEDRPPAREVALECHARAIGK